MSVDIEAIRNTIAQTFDIPAESVGNDSSSQTIKNWDSVGHINLVMALEQELKLSFTMDEIAQLRDFASICRVVADKAPR
jgi:acyl carrier protein